MKWLRKAFDWTHQCFVVEDKTHHRKFVAALATFSGAHLLSGKAVDLAVEHVFLAVHEALAHLGLLVFTMPIAGVVLIGSFVFIKFTGNKGE